MPSSPKAPHGRGTLHTPDNRYAEHQRQPVDDGWTADDTPAKPKTVIHLQPAKSIISHNNSPDLRFSQSINPYQGCEHGCIYCFARPSHAYWGYSPGLDFETQIIAKPNAAALFKAELAKPGYVCQPICLGANTDIYQPAERELGLTRQLLEVALAARQPLFLLSKNALIERDLDLLQELARLRLVQVLISIPTLDRSLARLMEPRASQPERRLQALATLAQAGVPTGVLVSPIIPALNDAGIEEVLLRCQQAGANLAGYALLRLPLEIAELFEQWLAEHFPLKQAHVMSLIRQMRGGKNYDSQFGKRMRGEGQFAELLAQRFKLARQRLGLDGASVELDCSQFKPPRLDGQLELF